MSETGQSLTEYNRAEKSADAFNRAKIRIQKSARIKDDISPSDGRPYSRHRVDEIRNIERRSEQGDAAKETGLEELFVDARGYQKVRFCIKRFSPDSKDSITETLVSFVRPTSEGGVEHLQLGGKLMALNADLYESRLISHQHAQGIEYDIFTIPIVNVSLERLNIAVRKGIFEMLSNEPVESFNFPPLGKLKFQAPP